MTDVRGHFSLAVPADLPANAVLRLVATGSQATAAAARRLLDYDPVTLSLATTVAYVEIFGANSFESRASSNSDGSYSFYRLATGDYTLVVAVDGANQSSQIVHVN